jgi:hypothetical protein
VQLHDLIESQVLRIHGQSASRLNSPS